MGLIELNGLTELKKPEPLAKMAYEALRSSILSNRLTSDVVYNEKGLAEQLGISRTPVREALLELASQGLVEFLPRKGVIVNKFSSKDIEEIFELRRVIELASVEKICKTCSSDALLPLEGCLEKQRDALGKDGDPIIFMEIDRDFHLTISKLTANGRLVAIMQNIRDILQLMGLHALTAGGRMEKVVEEHTRILKAIQAKDVQDALMHMEYHLEQSKKAVKTTKT